MKNNEILLSRGAGYIGNPVVPQLGQNKESVITLDKLSTGFETAVSAGRVLDFPHEISSA